MSSIQEIQVWLPRFIASFFPDHRLVTVQAPKRALSSLDIAELTLFPTSPTWDFKPDLIAVILDAENSAKLVIINLAKKGLGLTEFGEMRAMSVICKPTLAVQFSEKGLSRDLYGLLLDDDIRARLTRFSAESHEIITAQWANGDVVEGSVFPHLEENLAIAFSASNKHR